MSGYRFFTTLGSIALMVSGSAMPEDTCPALIAGREWEPISIKVLMGVTDGMDSAALEALTTEVLPRAVGFWEKSMRIRRTGSPVRMGRTCLFKMRGVCIAELPQETCGHTAVPDKLLGSLDVYTRLGVRSYPEGEGEAGADFVLIVTAISHPRTDDMLYVGYANICAVDECGRPTMGFVNVNANLFSKRDSNSIISSLVHELSHALGFMTTHLHDWRLADGSRRNGVPKWVPYSVETDTEGNIVRVKAGDHKNVKKRELIYRLPIGVVESLATRGFGKGSTCRCPIDPHTPISEADLTECLVNRGNCAFAITTPKVKAAAREFFDCDELEGMELENQNDIGSLYFLDSHWKARLVYGEIMSSHTRPSTTPFVSAMTFAFFEDSGWYQMDYSMTSTPVRGATWGYKAGCAFVQEKCINDETGEVQRPPIFPNAFCAVDTIQCSGDGKRIGRCAPRAATPPSFSVLPQYQYNNGLGSLDRLVDFCPVLTDEMSADDSHELFPSKRCLMGGWKLADDDDSGEMVRSLIQTETSIQCVGGQSYEVSSADGQVRGVCIEQGQVLTYPNIYSEGTRYIVCTSPAIICAQFRYPHLPASSPANQQVDGVDSPYLPLDSAPLVLNITPIATYAPAHPRSPRPLTRYPHSIQHTGV